MRDSLAPVVRALAEATVPGANDTELGEATRFVLDVHARMPAHLRVPITLLTFVFDAASLPRAGRRFRSLRPEPRARHIEVWRVARIDPCRSLIRFYRGLLLFGMHRDATP